MSFSGGNPMRLVADYSNPAQLAPPATSGLSRGPSTASTVMTGVNTNNQQHHHRNNYLQRSTTPPASNAGGSQSGDNDNEAKRPLEDLSPEELALCRKNTPQVYDAVVLYDRLYLNTLAKLGTKETELDKCIEIGQEVLDQLQDMRNRCKILEEDLAKSQRELEERTATVDQLTLEMERSTGGASSALNRQLETTMKTNRELMKEIEDLKLKLTSSNNRSPSPPLSPLMKTTRAGRFDIDLSAEDAAHMTAAAAHVSSTLYSLRCLDERTRKVAEISAAIPPATFSDFRIEVDSLHKETLSMIEELKALQDGSGGGNRGDERRLKEKREKEMLEEQVRALKSEIRVLEEANEEMRLGAKHSNENSKRERYDLEDNLDERFKEIKQLGERNRNLKAEVDRLDDINEDLRRTSKQATARALELQRDLEGKNTECQTLTETIRKLKVELRSQETSSGQNSERTVKQLEEYTEKVKGLEQLVELKEQELRQERTKGASDHRNATAKEMEISELKGANMKLSAKVDQLEADLIAEKQSSRTKTETTGDMLEEALRFRRESETLVRSEGYSSLPELVEEMKRTELDTQKKIRAITKDYEALERDHLEARSQIDAASRKTREAEQESSKLRDALQTLRDEATAAGNQIKENSQKDEAVLRSLRQDKENAQIEIEKLERQLDGLQENLREERTKAKRSAADRQVAELASENEVLQLKEANEALKTQVQTLREQVASASEHSKSLTAVLEKENAKLRSESQAYFSLVSQLEEELALVADSLLSNNAGDIRAITDGTNLGAEDALFDNSQVSPKPAAISSSIRKRVGGIIGEIITTLRESLNLTEAELSTGGPVSRRRLSSKLMVIKTLPDRVGDVAAEEISILTDMISVRDEQHRRHQLQLRERHDDIHQLNRRLEAASCETEKLLMHKTKLEADVHDLRASLNESSEKLHALTSVQSDETRERSRLNDKIMTLQQQLEHCLDDKDGELKSLKSRLENMKRTLDQEREERSRADDETYNEMSSLRAQNNKLAQQAQQATSKLLSERTSLNDEVERLQYELKSLSSIAEEKDEKIDNYTAMLRTAKKEIETMGADIASLRSSKGVEMEDRISTIKLLESQLYDMRQSQSDRDNEVRELKSIRNKLESRISHLEELVAQREEELRQYEQQNQAARGDLRRLQDEVASSASKEGFAAATREELIKRLEEALDQLSVTKARIFALQTECDKVTDLYNRLKKEHEVAISTNNALSEHVQHLEKRLGTVEADRDPLKKRLHEAITVTTTNANSRESSRK